MLEDKNRVICFSKKFIGIFVLLMSACDKDDSSDIYGIDYGRLEPINAIVVDTQAGWTLLSEKYGFLELIEPLHDSLKIDALKVTAQIHRGNTYFDGYDNTLDNITHERDFTFAVIVSVEEKTSLYVGPDAPIIEIFWSQNYNDEVKKFSDGYGYFVQAIENGFKIGQPSFPGIAGLGAFKTEVEAYKTGMLVMHRLKISGRLPSTKQADLNFLKIDWYVYIPD
jgi:hypothetical protein